MAAKKKKPPTERTPAKTKTARYAVKDQTAADARRIIESPNPIPDPTPNFSSQEMSALIRERVDILVPLVCRRRNKPLYIYPYQEALVDWVVNRRHDWQLHMWPTGSGKTFALGIAFAILPVVSPGEEIVNISYTDKQAKIIFNEVKDVSLSSPALAKYVDRNQPFTNEEMNWTTEANFICRTANENNKGETLLGLHKTVVSIDESCSIHDDIYNSKIDRITAPDDFTRMMVEITTTHRRNHVYEAAADPACKTSKITWREGLAAGRYTVEFLERRRRKLGPEAFKVWYECEFPSKDANALFDPQWVRNAVEIGKSLGLKPEASGFEVK